MGMLISSATRSQQVAFQIATISSMLPSIVLSGLIFPIQNMPTPVQAITLVVVPRYFVSALRKIILKGAAFEAVWPEFVALLALGLMFNLLAAHRTRRSV
jgi:ABC-2 type transport system permease protein